VWDCRRFSVILLTTIAGILLNRVLQGWAQVKGYHGPVSDPVDIFYRYYWDIMYIQKIQPSAGYENSF
jgi:hypothetical protein